jgi:hypothetical protein
VNLPILLANRVAQIHAPSEPPAPSKKIPKVVTCMGLFLSSGFL